MLPLRHPLPATQPSTATVPALDPAVRRALAGIRPEALRAHMRFLADDRLEGRGTGTRGHALGAAYMASEFEAAGLAPAGAGGGWYQEVPFRRMDRDPGDGDLALARGGHEEPLKRETDHILGNDPVHEQASVTAPLVFVGNGVTAPELGYDRSSCSAASTRAWGRSPRAPRARGAHAGARSLAGVSGVRVQRPVPVRAPGDPGRLPGALGRRAGGARRQPEPDPALAAHALGHSPQDDAS